MNATSLAALALTPTLAVLRPVCSQCDVFQAPARISGVYNPAWLSSASFMPYSQFATTVDYRPFPGPFLPTLHQPLIVENAPISARVLVSRPDKLPFSRPQ